MVGKVKSFLVDAFALYVVVDVRWFLAIYWPYIYGKLNEGDNPP